jgi:hypothetical protein
VKTSMAIVTYQRFMLSLAALAIAGLLSMHGFDPVVTVLDSPHVDHPSSSNAERVHHDIVGICLFIAATTGLVLGSREGSLRTVRASFAPGGFRLPLVCGTVAGTGLTRSHGLCVLRR